MNRFVVLVVCLLILIFSHNEIDAKETCLWMAEVNFCLGMTSEDINKQLPSRYKMFSISEDGSFFVIVEKSNNDSEIIGQLGFENKKLSHASKEWGQFHSNDTLKLGKALLSVIQNINESGEKLASISTDAKAREPGEKADSIIIDFQTRSISISIVESTKHGKVVAVSEYIK